MSAFENALPGLTLGHRNRRSKLPNAFQLKMLKLHAKAVSPIDMQYLHDHVFSDSASERIRRLLKMTHYNSAAPGEVPSPAYQMPASHADRMVEIGVFELVGTLAEVDL